MSYDSADVDDALAIIGDGGEKGVGVVELFHVNVTRVDVNGVFAENRGSRMKRRRKKHSLKEGMERVMSEVDKSMSKMEGEVEKSMSTLFTASEIVLLFWETDTSDCRLERDTGTNVIETGTKRELGKSIRMLVHEMVVKVVSYKSGRKRAFTMLRLVSRKSSKYL